MPSARGGGSILHSSVPPRIHLSGIRRTVAISCPGARVSSSVPSQLELFMKMSAICRHQRDSVARQREARVCPSGCPRTVVMRANPQQLRTLCAYVMLREEVLKPLLAGGNWSAFLWGRT